jgi:type I restriction enzyme, S subunit
LEAMAKALFKSWFVDFDPVRAKAKGRPTGLPAEISDLFPDSFEDSELGEIPRGWKMGRLEEILEIDPPRQLRRGSISPYLEMKGVPTSGHNAVDVIGREFSSGSKFRNGDTLLARITPCLENGKTAFVDFLKDGETGWGSTEFIVMCGRREEINPFAYYLARSEVFRHNAIQNMVGSSGRQRVPSDAVSGFTLTLPPEGILVMFGLLATDLMRRIRANADQSVILSKIRDALLPKLISGEIRIPDDEKMLEEAGI